MKRISKIMLVALTMVMCMFYHNEVKAATTEVAFGQEYSGVINDTNSSHGYKIVLQESGYLTTSYEQSSNKQLVWSLYDASNKRLSSETLYSYTSGSVGVRLDAGTYYVYIYKPYSWMNDSTYKIKFSFQSANETFTYTNDFISDVSNKGSIPYVTAINGHISIGETDDYYKIVVPKKGTITVDITTSNEDIYAMLCDKNGNSVSEIKNFFSYSTRESKTISLSKGTYYLRIWQDLNRTGTYTFKVSYSKSALKTFSLKKVSNKSMVVKADKAGAVSGYEIRYKKGSGKWKNINVGGSKKLNKTIKKLSKGKKYTVQIRTYYKYNGKVLYSDWSVKRKITLK
ncbi:MAG: fibronectin type III domain-containing protein [Lachnospiraceae bacterium]|nr:fibronectin type III domain-containing protein [Lachnospiraceae bacterium]